MWSCRCLFRHIPILAPITVPPILAMTLPAFWWQNGQELVAERRSLSRRMTFGNVKRLFTLSRALLQ